MAVTNTVTGKMNYLTVGEKTYEIEDKNAAPLASPAFTGTPTAPTATAGTSTTQIATTEFVQNAMSGAGAGTVTSVGVSNATNGGLSVSGSPITGSGTITVGHSNILSSAQTTQAVYPIKIDKNGHISAYGSAVTSMPASDVSSWAKADSKPTYTYTEVGAAASSHTHGNITNGGDITATAPTIANGDQLVINDNSASKITNGPTFDGSTTTTALTPKGTWETFSKFSGSYNDLSNKPTIPTVPTNVSAFTNDKDYINKIELVNGASSPSSISLSAGSSYELQGYDDSSLTRSLLEFTMPSETDPTVPSWAKASTKPTYTASEVGAVAGNARVFYGTCATAAATAAKVVNCSSYDALTVGDILIVNFTYANTNTSTPPTLNVNGTGAKELRKYYNGELTTPNVNDPLSGTVVFVYNGTYWVFVNDNNDTTTDENMKWTASTTTNTFYPLQSTSTAATSTANTLNSVSFYQYYNTTGGYRRFTLGNATAYTSTGGAYGTIRLYGTGATYYGDLNPGTVGANSLTGNRTWTLPNATGTIALTSDIPTVPTITLNGSASTAPSFYAPTSAGTSGYYLKSNGSGAPSWTSFPTIPSITLNGSSTTSPSFYAPTSAGTNGYYLKSNGSGAPSWAAIETGGVSDVTVAGTSVVTSGVATIAAPVQIVRW